MQNGDQEAHMRKKEEGSDSDERSMGNRKENMGKRLGKKKNMAI